ncbi:InlB B-repeat-containing protein, partial [Peptoniphilus senegalensis]
MDKNKKSKTFNKMSIRKGISLSLAALTLAGPIVPYAVYANPTAAVQDTIRRAPENQGAYPKNIVDTINWDNKGVTDNDKDYWSLNQNIGIEPTQKIVRVTTSDPIENVDINYQGYFVDANGRTNLRFVYMEKSAAISAVWNRILLRFDDDLYDKIDFEKSYGIGSDGKEYKLTQSNGKNEKALDINGMVGARTQNRTNIPMNIVLKEGLAFTDLGSKNLKIQMRLVDKNSKRIYAFAPKGSSIDYSVYTKQTVIPIESNVDGLFLRGPKEEDGKKFAFQRAVMSEFIANPENYSDTSELGILRTEYQAERDSTNPKDVKDGKPAGFIQAFDAKLVPYLKADAAGNIAYTNMLDANRKEVKGVGKVGVALENINYSNDKKVAYIVFGQQNFVKDGVKVVTLDKFDGKINQGGFYYTAIDYVVDKKKLQDTFETTGTTKVDFDIMTGWAETNPTGWTIFEKDYDNDHVVDEGESFMIDTTQDPARKQIMIQVGDPEEAFIRTMQGYYSGHKDGQKGFEQIENIGVGLYELTLREGATIKAGEKFRVLIPDAADHEGPVNFLETHNGSKYNQGAAKLKLQKDRNINMHLYRKDKGSFKVYYTLKGKTEQKELVFNKGGLWQYSDKDKILDGTPNRGIDPSGGNFWINTKKLEPGKDIIVEAYNAAGEKEENLTSWFKYKPLEKSAEKYERMAWVDHAEDLSSVGIDKSTYVPYQEIFTNDYKTGTDEIYKDPRLVPADKEDFMAKTGKIEGFTQYDGGKIRMRYIESNGKTLVGKAEAAANEYNDKGDVVGTDLSQKVTINNKEYEAMPYELDLSTVSELRDADPETGLELKKDMRLIFNASNGSSLPSDWYETRVKTRVLFDATDGQFEDTSKKAVKVVPDNVKYYQEDGYTANGFTGANVKENTGDTFPAAPTATGKTFLGWVTEEGKTELTKTVVTSEAFNKLDATKKFTAETPVDSHKVVYAIWSEEKLITFDANGGKFADGSTTKTDDIKDGVTAPDAPKQDGKTFLGWASTKDATAPEDGILDNVNEAKTVYAVWKDGVVEKTA